MPGPSPDRAPAARARPPRAMAPSRWALPDPEDADGSGLVGLGADLEPETLVAAYRGGIFPWPHEGMPLPWFSPDPRGVVPLEGLRVTRSLRQRLRRSGWHTTVDAAFPHVIGACATIVRTGEAAGTWITPEMQAAYRDLHELGWARSLEVWDGDRLVGGLYGMQLGGVFTGESMFHLEPDASKVALVDLAARFAEAGGAIVDVQLVTPHLATLGAVELPRASFLRCLARHRDDDVRLRTDPLPVSRLAAR